MFEVPEGSLYGFLGPNGAGKTTTIRMLLGLLQASSGDVEVFGLDPWRDGRRVRAEIGYVPGDLRLYPWLSVESGLRLVGGARRRDVSAPGRQLAERFGLDPRVRVRRMSRGMRQKLGLILALAPSPRLLILDEPASGLDPLMQEQLLACLRERSKNGDTVFFSSHTLRDVDALCDRVAIIRSGRIVADESLEALRERRGYDVSVRFGRVIEGEPPAFLQVERRTEYVWSGVLTGRIHEFVQWLAGLPVEELIVQEPELESLFRRYYEAPE